MKKFFFAAALAVVAIGGASASNSKFFASFYPQGLNSPTINCNTGTVSCAVKYGTTIAYTVPASSGLQDVNHQQDLRLLTAQP